jgi:carbon storage regulator
MLVLTRKIGEQLVVPELQMILTVLSIQGGRVRLGLVAPPEIKVLREELRDIVYERRPATIPERMVAEESARVEAPVPTDTCTGASP